MSSRPINWSGSRKRSQKSLTSDADTRLRQEQPISSLHDVYRFTGIPTPTLAAHLPHTLEQAGLSRGDWLTANIVSRQSIHLTRNQMYDRVAEACRPVLDRLAEKYRGQSLRASSGRRGLIIATSGRSRIVVCASKSHGRYIIFQMAEVAIARQMFQEILRLIAELRPQPPPAPA